MLCVVQLVHYHPLGFLCEPLWMYLGPWGLMIREMIESQLLQSPHHSRIPKKTWQNQSFARGRVSFFLWRGRLLVDQDMKMKHINKTVNKLISCYLFLVNEFFLFLLIRTTWETSHKNEIPSHFFSFFLHSFLRCSLQATHLHVSTDQCHCGVFWSSVVAIARCCFLFTTSCSGFLAGLCIHQDGTSELYYHVMAKWSKKLPSSDDDHLHLCFLKMPTEFWWVGVVAALLGNYDNHPLN